MCAQRKGSEKNCTEIDSNIRSCFWSWEVIL